jgi:hypothetical protein
LPVGGTGKRTELIKHSTLKINADLVASAPGHWDPQLVRTRTAQLTEAVLDLRHLRATTRRTGTRHRTHSAKPSPLVASRQPESI